MSDIKNALFNSLMLYKYSHEYSNKNSYNDEEIHYLDSLFLNNEIASFIIKNKIFKNLPCLQLPNLMKIIENTDLMDSIFPYLEDNDTIAYVLNLNPHFIENKNLVYQILNNITLVNNFNYKPFETWLKNEEFMLQVSPHILNATQDFWIHIPSICKRSFKEGCISFNSKEAFPKEIFNNIEFVKEMLKKPTGHFLYRILPDNIKKNNDICEIMTEYFPQEKLENYDFMTIDKFYSIAKDSLQYKEFFYFCEYAYKFRYIFNSDKKILELFSFMKDNTVETYFEFNNKIYIDHPISLVFNVFSSSAFIKEFKNNEKFNFLSTLKFSSHQSITDFEKDLIPILPIIYQKIETYYLKHKLDNTLNINKIHTSKIKV